MRFFLYYLEELYYHSRDGRNGRNIATFPDTKTVFVDSIYRCRSGAATFEYSIFKGPAQRN